MWTGFKISKYYFAFILIVSSAIILLLYSNFAMILPGLFDYVVYNRYYFYRYSTTSKSEKSLAKNRSVNIIYKKVRLLENDISSVNFFKQEYEKLKCKFALLDPWDKSILSKIYHPRSIDCKLVQEENFTYVDFQGRLHLNETVVEKWRAKKNKFNGRKEQPTPTFILNCTYSTFDRDEESEDDWQRRKFTQGRLTLNKPVKLDANFVEVTCRNENDPASEIYYNLHAHPFLPLPNLSDFGGAPPSEDRLSVLLLIMDGTSTSVLRRHLWKTYAYVKNVMKMKSFRGFSKIADNTFPNMMAVLTGNRYLPEQDDMPADVRENLSKIKFDDWPYVWKLYKKNGYVTVFNEENAEFGVFHYFRRGFKRKPVDYFYFPYWNAVEDREYERNKTDNDPYCFRNVPKVQLLLDIAERHLVTMRDVLQFQYVFLTTLCHESDSSEAERADEYVAAFFKKMHQQNLFNKTVILFFSDHGHRFTPVRSTLVGLLEERTPMFNVWFPPWFYQRYPKIEQNLDLNAIRLSSQFDVHETLIDIANGNFEGHQRPQGSRGYSQLYPIPANRTCFQAGVPDHYCTCISMDSIEPNSTEAIRAGLALMNHVNKLLSSKSASDKKCLTFTNATILRAERLYVNEEVAQGHVVHYDPEAEVGTTVDSDATSAEESADFVDVEKAPDLRSMNKIRVAIEVEPMGAQFEALLIEQQEKKGSKTSKNADNNNKILTVQSDVSRLNTYGSQSWCIRDTQLKKLCVCR